MLEIKDLTISISDRYLIKNLNLILNNGDKLAIIGEEGNGKSTLLKSILGICEYAEISGNINLKGNRIGYLEQSISNDKLDKSVYEFLFIDDTDYYDKINNLYKYLEIISLTDDILKTGIYYPLEGYLFPDTYEFMNKDVSVDTIITTLLNEFNKKVSPYKEEIENSNYNIHELITLASIAESESLPGADRKKVVSVSVNRMKNGMSLGSDMTAYYAYKLDDYKNGGLTIEQFNNCSSPYNTRCLSKMGLPIGPISNPSLDSIVGAIEYEDTTYLFYIADCSGKTYFTNTYDEFMSKINELQQQGRWCEVSR